jgi:hypothetical protein
MLTVRFGSDKRDDVPDALENLPAVLCGWAIPSLNARQAGFFQRIAGLCLCDESSH